MSNSKWIPWVVYLSSPIYLCICIYLPSIYHLSVYVTIIMEEKGGHCEKLELKRGINGINTAHA